MKRNAKVQRARPSPGYAQMGDRRRRMLTVGENIDLKRNPAVLGIERRPGELLLRARSSTNRTQDNINIVFATEPRLEIRSWTVRDMQSGATSVVFRDVRTGLELADSLFAVPVKAPSIRKS